MMKRYFSAVFLFGLMSALTAGLFYRPDGMGETNFNRQNFSVKEKSDAIQTIRENYGKLPLVFEENRGQTDGRVKFLSRGVGYTLFLTESEAVMTLYKADENTITEDSARPRPMNTAILKLKTVGSNPPSKIEGHDEQIGKTNYFIGEDSQNWQRDVPNFAKIRYSQIYDGVDLVYYGNGRELEYDFIVQPNTDPAQIALAFEGADEMKLDASGDLILRLGTAALRQRKPVAYQEFDGARREIAANYQIRNQTIGFEIGEYDSSKPLIIDPILSYGTYLGSVEYEISHGIAVDAAGNAYVTGYALPPTFPTTPGSVRPTINSDGLTPFVTKLNPTGSALIYSTYLGGAGEGIAVDAEGNAYTTGSPLSQFFSTTPGALDMGRGGIGVTKLNPQGNQRIYAARFGSSGTDYAHEIAIDSQGNAVVIGLAGCFTSCDFPILNAAQPTPPTQGGGGFAAKLNATGSALIYSTYLGTGSEELWSVDVDAAGNAYVTGNTTSFNFPTTPGAFDRTFNCPDPPFCNADSFVTKIPSAGGAYAYSTYLGGRGSERGWAIAVDDAGNAYAAGYTDGRFSGAPDEGFPTTPGAFKVFGSTDAYLTKLNSTGSALVYSTLLGGEGTSCGEERARDVDVDRLGFAYVVGLTFCNNFPLANPLQSAPSSFAAEAFLTKFNQNGSALVYSTYLGGPRYDEAYSVAVDAAGSAYVTGTTSGGFQQITPGAFDTTWNGANAQHPDDIFVIKVSEQLSKIRFDFDGDGKADVSVFRPSDRVWYLLNSQNGFAAAQFGLSSDKITPADFDGDGKTDLAVYRDGVWYILQSQTNQVRINQFGLAGDVPQPADFDGDGKADLAVFRPSDRIWYLLQSTSGFAATQFGLSDDKPVAADYDGDGKTDIAVFRASNGVWHLLRSRDGYSSRAYGISTDKPVPADYDGDGKTDLAIYRNGTWWILNSGTNLDSTIQFGLSSDNPTPADYDGDGKADISVFRDGVWYLQRSTAGFTALQFGLANDIPVPSAYLR